jgi:cytochrome P450
MDISSSSPFSRAFDHASDQTGRRFQNPLYFVTELLTGVQFRSSLAEVKKFGQQIVSNARKRRSERLEKQSETPSSNVDFGSLVDSLMDAFNDDPTLTADAALNFLSAGRDTTAQSLTWTFYSLMRHPSALASLRQEIDPTFPSQHQRSPCAQPLMQLNVASLQPSSIPHTISTFNESLRLHPSVPFEIKQCQIDTTLPDGTFLPSGSIIVWCIWAMNRSHEIWGENSENFRPERWLNHAAPLAGDGDKGVIKLLSKTPFEFPVFNGGPRSCLGKKMAELMACWVLLQVCREFDFEEVFDDGADVTGDGVIKAAKRGKREKGKREERRSQNSLTLPMEGGLPCLVRLRWT